VEFKCNAASSLCREIISKLGTSHRDYIDTTNSELLEIISSITLDRIRALINLKFIDLDDLEKKMKEYFASME